jgi:hypothetical protein
MIVWGGEPLTTTGGAYCACVGPVVHYRDADGDGHGSDAPTTVACAGSAAAGWVANDDDCDDTDPAVHPGAAELCNDADDDCDTVADDGFAVPGPPSLALDTGAGLRWAVAGASTGFDVVRGSLATLRVTDGDFTAATSECVHDDTTATSWTDTAAQPPGTVTWYLVRAVNCDAAGSWDSGGTGQHGSRDAEIAASAAACP